MAVDLAEVLRFGRYEPLFRIGRGGMAEVYAARISGEGGFQKLVAVKRMLPHLTDDQKFVDMFLDEARLAASISSPHVVATYDLGRGADDSLYIVMELVIGVTLADVVAHQKKTGTPIPPALALELLAQAAQGLDDAHEARAPNGEPMHLVHRDVTPRNVLVGADGRVRVVDFGIARALWRLSQTLSGELKGTFAYSAPEQVKGAPLDRRSDVWSLGVVAWELLCGRRLFTGRSDVVYELTEMPIPRPHEVRPDLPASISDLVLTAVSRDPSYRYPTAGQLGSALRRAIADCGDYPSQREIGGYVKAVGGPALERLRARIHSVPRAAAPAPVTAAIGIDDPEAWAPGNGATSLLTGEKTFVGTRPGRAAYPEELPPDGATIMTPAPDFGDAPELDAPADARSDRKALPLPSAADPFDEPTIRDDGHADTVLDVPLPRVEEEESVTRPRPAPTRPAAPPPRRGVDPKIVLLAAVTVVAGVLLFLLGFALSR